MIRYFDWAMRSVPGIIMSSKTNQEERAMSKTLLAFFSRADENYFGGAMRYVKIGNTEIVWPDEGKNPGGRL